MLEPCYIQDAQKQPLADVLQSKCSGKFYWIRWKMPGFESIFHKVAGLDWLQRKCFSMNFVKFSRTPFLQNTTSDCFWMFITKLLLLSRGCGVAFSCLVLCYWKSDFKTSFGIASLYLVVAGDLDQLWDKIMDC